MVVVEEKVVVRAVFDTDRLLHRTRVTDVIADVKEEDGAAEVVVVIAFEAVLVACCANELLFLAF